MFRKMLIHELFGQCENVVLVYLCAAACALATRSFVVSRPLFQALSSHILGPKLVMRLWVIYNAAAQALLLNSVMFFAELHVLITTCPPLSCAITCLPWQQP